MLRTTLNQGCSARWVFPFWSWTVSAIFPSDVYIGGMHKEWNMHVFFYETNIGSQWGLLFAEMVKKEIINPLHWKGTHIWIGAPGCSSF